MKRLGKRGAVFLAIVLFLQLCGCTEGISYQESGEYSFSLEEIPDYSGEPYVQVEGNEPEFEEEESEEGAYEFYSPLDSLERCGEAEAKIGQELMPKEERESISEVEPSGWKNRKYEGIDGDYLYNRCHLIGFQLTGENANEKNLITGTRYMNTQGMLPFENQVAEYVRETDNHVMYRVTPVFEGDNLVASGVEMEAESIEDQGEGISFHVYVYNVQPGIEIDYATGESWQAEEAPEKLNQEGIQEQQQEGTVYVLNTGTGKFHRPSCSSVQDMKEKSKETYTGEREKLQKEGYKPCKICNP